jgi:VIT1/CCC1 family predicted Fe2+/Mn2+ transporter
MTSAALAMSSVSVGIALSGLGATVGDAVGVDVIAGVAVGMMVGVGVLDGTACAALIANAVESWDA